MNLMLLFSGCEISDKYSFLRLICKKRQSSFERLSFLSSKKGKPHFFLLIASNKNLPGLNLTVVLAGIITGTPVFGLRAGRLV